MRLIDADKLLEGEHFILKCKSEFGITEIDVFRREVIDNAPTVEPCYQTTSCLDCKMYDKENHHCPRFCEVIRELVKETENEGL